MQISTYPFLHIDILLDKLASARYFPKIDLANAHHQVQVEFKHEVKNAFSS